MLKLQRDLCAQLVVQLYGREPYQVNRKSLFLSTTHKISKQRFLEVECCIDKTQACLISRVLLLHGYQYPRYQQY
jgi:hypothetical protein